MQDDTPKTSEWPHYKSFSILDWIVTVLAMLAAPVLLKSYLASRTLHKIFNDLGENLPLLTRLTTEFHLLLVAGLAIIFTLLFALWPNRLKLSSRRGLIAGAFFFGLLVSWAGSYALLLPVTKMNKEMAATERAQTNTPGPVSPDNGAESAAIRQIINDARLVPNFETGRITGIKIFAIRAGGVFDQLGARNGDILKAINGTPVSSDKVGMHAALNAVITPGSKLEVWRNGAKTPITLVSPLHQK